MDIPFTVDLISDLYLSKTDQFDWTGKPTSLFCVVAGGLSNDLNVIQQTLEHLGSLYRGVFYIDGSYEHDDISRYETRIEQIRDICQPISNVIYMHNHAVLLNGMAFIGVNGWFENDPKITGLEDVLRVKHARRDDLGYLSNSIRNLQLHRDALKIVVISSSVPSEHLLYGKKPSYDISDGEPGLALLMDTDHKVTHWLYGGTQILADEVIRTRRYVNNPQIEGQPYWPKQIII